MRSSLWRLSGFVSLCLPLPLMIIPTVVTLTCSVSCSIPTPIVALADFWSLHCPMLSHHLRLAFCPRSPVHCLSHPCLTTPTPSYVSNALIWCPCLTLLLPALCPVSSVWSSIVSARHSNNISAPHRRLLTLCSGPSEHLAAVSGCRSLSVPMVRRDTASVRAQCHHHPWGGSRGRWRCGALHR